MFISAVFAQLEKWLAVINIHLWCFGEERQNRVGWSSESHCVVKPQRLINCRGIVEKTNGKNYLHLGILLRKGVA